MSITSYRPKGSTIKAIQFNEEDPEEVRTWCNGRVVGSSDDKPVYMLVPTLNGVLELYSGNYLCWNKADGFYILTSDEFESRFEPVRVTTRSKN